MTKRDRQRTKKKEVDVSREEKSAEVGALLQQEKKKKTNKTTRSQQQPVVPPKAVKGAPPQEQSGFTFTTVGQSYKILKHLRRYERMRIYRVEHHSTGKPYILKSQLRNSRGAFSVTNELNVYMACKDIIPKSFLALFDKGYTNSQKFIIVENANDIGAMLNTYKTFKPQTIHKIALFSLRALQELHNLGFAHCDIRLESLFCSSAEMRKGMILLGNFSLSFKMQPGAPTDDKRAIYIDRFSSRAVHDCKRPTRKDDLESWIFLVFYLLGPKYLPWIGSTDEQKVHTLKNEFFQRCRNENVPQAYTDLALYIGQLGWDSKVEYHKIEAALAKVELKDSEFEWDEKTTTGEKTITNEVKEEENDDENKFVLKPAKTQPINPDEEDEPDL